MNSSAHFCQVWLQCLNTFQDHCMFQCWSESPYYLYNCCYFQVQFIAVWTHCSKGCHCLHVTNAPKAHIHKDQYPKNSDTICKLHVLCMLCLSAQNTVLHCSSNTRKPHRISIFCVSHYPIQIYPEESERADHHELADTAAAIAGRNIWIQMDLFWSFGQKINCTNAGLWVHDSL